VIRKSLFSGEVYNIVTKNWTVREIIENIESVSGVETQINLVDVVIMNQLSYEVSSEKFTHTGFTFNGNLRQDIEETLVLLDGIRNV
jgi:hypothetical protein